MYCAEKFYNNNKENNIEQSNELKKKIAIISWSRLLIIIGAVITFYISYKKTSIQGIIAGVLLSIIFIGAVIYHNSLLEEKERKDILININDKGLKRINGLFKEFDDSGLEYLDDTHPFINDLDIFGYNSLFQYINSTVTSGGRLKLSKLLKREVKLSPEDIVERQKAIEELAGKVEFRQNVVTEGSLKKHKNSNEENINLLNQKNNKKIQIRIIIASIFMLITAACIYVSAQGIIPETFILLNLMVNFIVVKVLCADIKADIEFFESIKGYIYSYSRIFELIEDENFESSYLKNIQKELKNDGISCKEELKKFCKLLSWIGDSSNNAYYIIINVLFFTDVFLMKKLNNWRNNYGDKFTKWLEVLYEIDSLSSVANIAFENDEWEYPEILQSGEVIGKNIGHPLLGKRAVTNTFSIKDLQKVALITGSNMSGKSTFLRTIGINMILAYIGAPVYAEEFKCGVMNVYTCMRTKDNLEESISSFYAEILRIKILIEACKRGEKVFFLLDEIFKGTNSKDRHTGASVLIKQLIKYGGVGLISTHDLELCSLENENIINYNFREFYEEDKIKFDYKLRRGKSETQNAIHLMKLAGIEII